ncbi:NUDIX domain-containing protein [Limnochorda pilosa]|uniref:NUDIX domain-containing protein n=1 Tax=Limnochorda pilosa TaxID=1555112 RepID=UPI001EB76551|nr:NUDIX domain-containing protein [Limnochorda pilosa]MBO2518140.1 hypothetical protein [Bacillota bacterium]
MAEKPPNRLIRCQTGQGRARGFPASQIRFRPAAYGIALDGEGRVLLARSVFHERWELPGGAVEPWETLKEDDLLHGQLAFIRRAAAGWA